MQAGSTVNKEEDLQEAQIYWRHGCTGGTVIGGTCVQKNVHDAQVLRQRCT
jgi:hypothetical protein